VIVEDGFRLVPDRTALHIAAENGGSQACAALLEGGADPDALDCDGQTPLQLAVKSNHPDAVRALLLQPLVLGRADQLQNAGTGGPLKGGSQLQHSMLHEQLQGGQQQAGQLRRKRQQLQRPANWAAGADGSSSIDPGFSALHLAARASSWKCLRPLLDAANADNTSRSNGAPSHTVNIRSGNAQRWTPLHCAVRSGCRPAVEMLLASGADMLVKDGSGQDVLALARSSKRFSLVDLLLTAQT
jgi:ankyrin repeat protein